jgi:RND family efflux transporter MFP subunit
MLERHWTAGAVWRWLGAIPILIVLLWLGCGRSSSPGHASASQTPARPNPVKVAAAAVVVKQAPVTIRATGTFTATESSDVSPMVSGQIIATPVDVGDLVRPGDVIARLDDRDARARLAQAVATVQQSQATAANAQAEENRSADLLKTGDISKSDFEKLSTNVATANAQVAQGQAQVTLAEQSLAETVIRAPFQGHVSARQVAAGEYVTTASKIATIVKIQPIRLELQIPEADAAKIVTGMTVAAQVVSHPAREFIGRVTAKNPALNVESRALTVVAEFPNADLKLNPGMFATAEVRLRQTQQVLFAPRAAVFTPTGSPSSQAYVVQEGKARIRVLQTGETQDDLVRVISGLEPGDSIVTSNQDKLFDGQPVDIQ